MSIGLLELLELVDAHDWDKDKPFAYEVLIQKYPEKKVYAKIDKLVRKGYLEFGVSARTGWLTAKGKAKLHELRMVSALERYRVKMLKEIANE